MEISSASQQFAVAEQKTVAYGRKQQLLSNEIVSTPTVIPAETDALSEDDFSADDGTLFNAYQTFGMVKHILATLGQHHKDWQKPDLAAPPAHSNSRLNTEVDTAVFAASFSSESLFFSSNQQQLANNGQRIATTEWELGYQSVQANFSGQLQMQDGNSVSFAFEFSMQVSWARYSYTEQPLQDPLIVSLDNSPAKLTDSQTEFDLFSNGSTVQLPQLAAQQFYLAYDRNKDQQVNNGTELFGPQSGQGFAELAEFDDNGNGFIDPGDDIWQYLYLWRPQQQLLSMTEAKLGAFSVSSAATPMPLLDKQQQQSGEIQRSGLAFTENARPVLVQQIDLVV
ncbi:hypothetical protein [Rheinheimera baltica]|uniref:hypothetical protein n=1 Tax=Rheinheimera baltica TaxID=67576 RepID=UPI00273D7F0B|nr:hypothetical protein [Rheinheimera baltica]MDP5150213.1 hypothetical protein [Rheinheimera baltica]